MRDTIGSSIQSLTFCQANNKKQNYEKDIAGSDIEQLTGWQGNNIKVEEL